MWEARCKIPDIRFKMQIWLRFVRDSSVSVCCILNPASCILHPASCILHPASCILHPAFLYFCIFCILNPRWIGAGSVSSESCILHLLSYPESCIFRILNESCLLHLLYPASSVSCILLFDSIQNLRHNPHPDAYPHLFDSKSRTDLHRHRGIKRHGDRRVFARIDNGDIGR
jgi:hypothetical protein